jgi:AAA+ superfamily predicted ATPase
LATSRREDLQSNFSALDEFHYKKVIFEMGSYYAPAIIYLEGLEAFGNRQDPDRDDERIRRMKTEFLIQCEGLYSFEVENPETKTKEYKPFMVIGSSECPSVLDGAVRRRFERRICLSKFRYYLIKI